MPRRKLIYTDYYPYHVTARSNNKEWFYLNKNEVWAVFRDVLNDLSRQYGLKVHAFVLMSNHYHLIASTDARFDLGVVMQKLQQRVSRAINYKAGRINHIFGGPYKGSLISTPTYYKTVLKYVYRNPVAAEICNLAEDYIFSTLNRHDIKTIVPYNIDCLVNYKKEVMLPWLNNQLISPGETLSRFEITKGLLKTEFKPAVQRRY